MANRRKFLKQLAGLTVVGAAAAGNLPPVKPSADNVESIASSDFVMRESRFYATQEMLGDAVAAPTSMAVNVLSYDRP